MRIHHAPIERHVRWEVDPETNMPVPHDEVVVLPSSAERIVHDGRTYKIQPDGTFDVPDEVAALLLRGPDWHRGPSPFGGAQGGAQGVPL